MIETTHIMIAAAVCLVVVIARPTAGHVVLAIFAALLLAAIAFSGLPIDTTAVLSCSRTYALIGASAFFFACSIAAEPQRLGFSLLFLFVSAFALGELARLGMLHLTGALQDHTLSAEMALVALAFGSGTVMAAFAFTSNAVGTVLAILAGACSFAVAHPSAEPSTLVVLIASVVAPAAFASLVSPWVGQTPSQPPQNVRS